MTCAFDNRGVAASTGTTPSTVARMVLDAIDFIEELGAGPCEFASDVSAFLTG